MGSTFGKVRKYNLHSMDTFKYQSPSEDELKSPLPGKNKDLFSRHQEASLKSRVEKSNLKLKTNYEEDNVFGPSYHDSLMPEYYNLGVHEEILLQQNASRSDQTTDHEDGDYITLKEVLSKPPTPPPLPENEPPPLPPRNGTRHKAYVPNVFKPDAVFSSNPRPNQKVYSAEDIDRLLRPLNAQNVNIKRSMTSFDPVHTERYQNPMRQPAIYYICPHVCECQKYNNARIHHDFSSPPPYNLHQNNDTGQHFIHNPRGVTNSSSKQPYSETFPNQHHSAQQQPSYPSVALPKYNTIAVDRNVHRHNDHRQMAQNIMKKDNSKYTNELNLERTSSLHNSQNIFGPQYANKNASFKEDKFHHLRHRRDPLRQTEVLSHPEFRHDPPVYRSLRMRPCYTIPEEGSWLPPFHYDPAVYHTHRRSYHQ